LVKLDVPVVVFWFAATNYGPLMAALAKLLGRKVVVITGGIDAVYVPDIDWGAMQSGWHRHNFGALMRLADSVLPFSSASKATILEQYRPARIKTAYPPVDTHFFTPGSGPIELRVVTCCYQYGAAAMVQKGLKTFVETAGLLPDISFVLIGNGIDQAAEELKRRAPVNVHFISRIPSRTEYRDFLRASSIYAQLSAHEGFGVSLAEAMACGCVPIVSDRYSLPEVVGDTGLVVPYGDPQATAQAIRQALAAGVDWRARVRDRVATQFTKQARQDLLFAELVRLIPTLSEPVVRIELGCGSGGEPGTIGVDLRRTIQTQALCDVRRSCFRSECADEVYSICVLEHLENPYELMDEIVRILKPTGQAFLQLPNLGTYSAHLDTTHRFLADLALWKAILKGYFADVQVIALGTRYRDNRLLRAINTVLVQGFRFHELAQGWRFVCRNKRPAPTKAYIGWWAEDVDR
jgi:SAM-dependent methyltransferase